MTESNAVHARHCQVDTARRSEMDDLLSLPWVSSQIRASPSRNSWSVMLMPVLLARSDGEAKVSKLEASDLLAAF